MFVIKLLGILAVLSFSKASIPLPLNHQFGGDFKSTQFVLIEGVVHSNPDEFLVKFYNSHHGNPIALQLEFSFHKNTLTMSARPTQNQNDIVVENPLKAGQKFKIDVRIAKECALITINGHYFVFHVQKSINYAYIMGDVDLTNFVRAPFSNEIYDKYFPDGFLTYGQAVVITGVGFDYYSQISLGNKKDQYWFHYSIRFNDKTARMNNWLNDRWQNEIVVALPHIERYKPFEITIVNQPGNLKICVDGKKRDNFPHRAPNPSDGYNTVLLYSDMFVLDYKVISASEIDSRCQ